MKKKEVKEETCNILRGMPSWIKDNLLTEEDKPYIRRDKKETPQILFPSNQQCLELFVKYKVPQNIKEHCMGVRNVAVFLAKKINENGESINIELVNSLALLHDIFKLASIQNITPNKYHTHNFSEEEIAMREELRKNFPNMHENQVAHEIFKEEYPQLAILLKDFGNPEKENKSWEELLVFYADGRVFRNNVVTLEERETYLKDFYPTKLNLIAACGRKLYPFEQKLTKLIKIRPEQLSELMKNEQ